MISHLPEVVRTPYLAPSDRPVLHEDGAGRLTIYLSESLNDLEAKRAVRDVLKARKLWPRIAIPLGAVAAFGRWLRHAGQLATGAGGAVAAGAMAIGALSIIAAHAHGVNLPGLPGSPPSRHVAGGPPAGGTVPVAVGHHHTTPGGHGGFPAGVQPKPYIPGPSRTPAPSAPGPVPKITPPPLPRVPSPKVTVPGVPLPKVPLPQLPHLPLPKLPVPALPKIPVPPLPSIPAPGVTVPPLPKVTVPPVPSVPALATRMPHHRKMLLAWVRVHCTAASQARADGLL